MRTFLNAIIVVAIPVGEFIVLQRTHHLGDLGPLLIVITLFPLMIWAAKQQGRANQMQFQKLVAPFGFQPAERDDVTLSVYPLRAPGWIATAASGEMRGLSGWIFNYVIHESGSRDKCICQTVMGFRVDDANLPIFQVRPLGLGPCKGDGYYGKDDSVCFPDALAFHRNFELLSSAEEGVRRHFDAKLLSNIAVLNDCRAVVQGYYTTVLFFIYGRRIEATEELEAFARKGADIAYELFAAEKRTMAAAAK